MALLPAMPSFLFDEFETDNKSTGIEDMWQDPGGENVEVQSLPELIKPAKRGLRKERSSHK